MKKIYTLLIVLLFPINIFAYSEYIIPGGENIGVEINSKGIVVVGFYKVDGKYIAKEYINVGDTVLEIEGKEVSSIDNMSKLIEENMVDNEVNIKVLRNNKVLNTKLKLVKEDEIYKTGLYIKDKVTGIGTLSYIDPETKIYGSLGHRIVINESDNLVEIRSGELFKSYVIGVDRSIDGRVGSKSASIDYKNRIGNVLKNTDVGIFGYYDEILPNKELIEVADFDEIKLGKASIYTTLDNETVEEFEIEIIGINEEEIDTNKSLSILVTDERLLENTGGIVQGMSGSPIIQGDKIIGAVTHVVVDEVKRGYAVFIRTMLEEGER